MKKNYDLILVGGGVIGLTTAIYCAKKNWKVAVLDAGEFGKGSSWAGAGILPAGATLPALDPLEQLRSISHRLHRDLASEIVAQTGIDNEFRRCGGLYLGRSPAERATLIANEIWWEEHGIEFERLSSKEIASRFWYLRDSETTLEGWWVKDDCRVRNPRHLKGLLRLCEQYGVDLFPHQNVTNITMRNGRAIGVECGPTEYHAVKICLTAGAWTTLLLNHIGIQTGIMPVRGQLVLYRCDQPILDPIIHDGNRYLVPRDDGHVLAGSCEEEVGFQCHTTESMIHQLSDWASSICALLDPTKIEKSWAGLRPGSFDTYPYLGNVPSVENLFVASGHFRHGLHWSTGTALLMQQLLFEEKTEMDLQPFRILRGNNSTNAS